MRRASRSVCGMDDQIDFSMDMSGESSFQYDGGDGNGGGAFDFVAKQAHNEAKEENGPKDPVNIGNIFTDKPEDFKKKNELEKYKEI